MIALVFGAILVVLGILALVREVLDLYVIVGVALILVGAWVLFGARDHFVRS
jgi:multisubunit Na+/H+ antiporter MnhB subunit